MNFNVNNNNLRIAPNKIQLPSDNVKAEKTEKQVRTRIYELKAPEIDDLPTPL